MNTPPHANNKNKRRKFNRAHKAFQPKLKHHKQQRDQSAIRSHSITRNLNEKANKYKRYVKNLSVIPLSNIEIIALGKGLKFIMTPEKPKRIDILKSVKDIKRKMRIRYIMQNKKNRFFKFRLPSKWVPEETTNSNLEAYLEATKIEIAKIPINSATDNTPKSERFALEALKNNRSIVIKPFDKGRGIAIMDRSDYQAEIERQLLSQHYEKLESDITLCTKATVRDTLRLLLSKHEIDESTFQYLNPYNHETRTPVIYVLPKVHKEPPTNSKFVGRPIISGNGSPTEKISEFVDYFLLPIVVKQHTYVKDSNHILNILEATPLPKNVILATLDVISMYTNTPQEEAINACEQAYEKAPKSYYDINKISAPSMRKLIELILSKNCFEFNKQFYLQKIGCAMGSQASPEICDIVMYDLENRIISTERNILKWLRYRDDILLLYTGTHDELTCLVAKMNEIHPFLKFTAEVSDFEVTYLDLKIFKGPRFHKEQLLDTKIHTKPTETFQYLERSSTHPLATFKGFVKGEVLRYARLCNNETDFIEKRTSFTEKLLMRDYTEKEIASATSGINHELRAQYIMNKPKCDKLPLVFKLTYTPHIHTRQIKEALLKNWHLITEHPELSKVFPEKPIIAYKRAKNLKDHLVRSKFTSYTESDESDNLDDTLLDALIKVL